MVNALLCDALSLLHGVSNNHGDFLLQTRILVTHSISFLPQVDRILVLSEGRITEQGTYQQLLSHKGPFSEILQTYGTEAEVDDDDISDFEGPLLFTHF